MNCIIGQSGGPTSVINSSLAGIIDAAIENGFDNIYGSLNGIEGIINNKIVKIDKDKYTNEAIADGLCRRPSSILGSCRYKLPEDLNDEIYNLIFKKLKELEITSFIYIGGNDSMDTVMKLNNYMSLNDIKGINIVGVPKTIDNDLCHMDHSPGFSSAAKYLIGTLKTIRADVDIYDLKSVTLVEIMGRNAGWLAASSLAANTSSSQEVVNLLYLGEHSKSKEDLIKEINTSFLKENNLIIAVSEGFMDSQKYFESNNDESFDKGFKHKRLAGIGQRLADYVNQELGVKTRAIELNIVQRSNHVISSVDSKEAYLLGQKALKLSIDNTNLIPIVKREESKVYEIYIDHVEPSEIANKEKLIPREWLTDNITLQKKISDYVLPLVKGEVTQEYVDGIIQFVDLKDFSERI